MTWSAKPRGPYGINSAEARGNMVMIYNQLIGTWTLEAICGLLGNMAHESGFNPWRWQNDSVSLTDDHKGYGLVQLTPAYGYVQDYGPGTPYFSPNLSVSTITSGATPQDGHAQIIVIDEDRAGKYLNRVSWCDYYDLSGTYPFANYKQITDLKKAAIAWLFNYEAPADRSEAVANERYASAQICYEYLSGKPPEPPEPPTPPKPPRPQSSNFMTMFIKRRII